MPPEPLKTLVIDYGSGNLRSVVKALERVGVQALVSSDHKEVQKADVVLLPGVGAGDAAMHALNSQGLVESLRQFVASGRPFLGVCLGMQLLMDVTEEGNAACLGIVPGRVRRLPNGLKVPHMGWNRVRFHQSHPLFQGISQDSYFYFVHSYYADPSDPSVVAGTSRYGITFCSVLVRDNVVATQFHPEKSGESGLQMYHNLPAWAMSCRQRST